MLQGLKLKQKHFKFGLELELFTLDKRGYMIQGGERLISSVHAQYPKIDIKKECGMNMIEIGCKPNVYIPNVMKQVTEELANISNCAEQEGILLYPFGTYPGKYATQIYDDVRYQTQENLFGKEQFSIAARCVGLHCHYTVPWEVLDSQEKGIKPMVNSKNKQSLLNIYNLFIAMDPALSTFTQSSPFYEGKRRGKSSRIIMYRGGDIFHCSEGLYANYQSFGALPRYMMTGTDLGHLIKQQFETWIKLLRKLEIHIESFLKRGSILDTAWNPVRINSIGTLEQRGMDANFPSIIVAVALIIKFISKKVQEEFIQVVPSDIGVKNPFRFENNIIYIPPDSWVRKNLQSASAFKGLEDENIFHYCKSLLNLGKVLIPENRRYFLEPLNKMIQNRKTVSDRIIEKAKEMGVDVNLGISNEKASELSLFFVEEFRKDIQETKIQLEKFQEEL